MTCEDIIQRLLDERHITVKEAMIMIKELVKNTIETKEEIKKSNSLLKDIDEVSKIWDKEPKKKSVEDFWNIPTVVCYGVQIPSNVVYSDAITSVTNTDNITLHK